MKKISFPLAILAGLFFSPLALAQTFSIRFESSLPVVRGSSDKTTLNELSGLAMGANNQSLWFISDNFKNVYNMSLGGVVNESAKISIGKDQMEGVVYVPASTGESQDYIYTVNEDDISIFKISLDGSHVSEHKLSDMDNWSSISHCFGDDNNGLEGITYFNHGSADESHFFVVKESSPGLIIKIDASLDNIVYSKCLNSHGNPSSCSCSNPVFNQSGIDFSGLCHDPVNSCFWIVSDDGQSLLMYNYDNNQLLDSKPLALSSGKIVNAEGVAVVGNKVYIVTDKQNSATLYTYQLTVTPAGSH